MSSSLLPRFLQTGAIPPLRSGRRPLDQMATFVRQRHPIHHRRPRHPTLPTRHRLLLRLCSIPPKNLTVLFHNSSSSPFPPPPSWPSAQTSPSPCPTTPRTKLVSSPTRATPPPSPWTGPCTAATLPRCASKAIWRIRAVMAPAPRWRSGPF